MIDPVEGSLYVIRRDPFPHPALVYRLFPEQKKMLVFPITGELFESVDPKYRVDIEYDDDDLAIMGLSKSCHLYPTLAEIVEYSAIIVYRGYLPSGGFIAELLTEVLRTPGVDQMIARSARRHH